MNAITNSTLGVLLFASLGESQELSFEVASVRPARPDATGRPLSHDPGARLTSEVSMRTEARGQMVGVKATMPMLASALSRPLQRKVIDETGLTGAYTFKLQFAADPKPGAEDAVPSDRPSLFVALPEQLGLNLKATKGSVDVFVIDHVEKPIPN